MPLARRVLQPATRGPWLMLPILVGCSQAEFRYSPDQAIDFSLPVASGGLIRLQHTIPTPALLLQLPKFQRMSLEIRLLNSKVELVPVNPEHETIPLNEYGFGLRDRGPLLQLIFEFTARTIADNTVDIRRYILELVSVDGQTKDSEQRDLFDPVNQAFPKNKIVEVIIDRQAPTMMVLGYASHSVNNGFSLSIQIMVSDHSPLEGAFAHDAFSLTGSATLSSSEVTVTKENSKKTRLFVEIKFLTPTELTGTFVLALDADKHTVLDKNSKKPAEFITNPQIELKSQAAGRLEKNIDWQAWVESFAALSPEATDSLAVDYGLLDPTTF